MGVRIAPCRLVKKMKISFWIPKTKNPQWIRDFINNEITQAGNIKSKQKRESVIKSLQTAIKFAEPGRCLYVEESDCTEDIYNDKEFNYHCGNDYIHPELPSDFN